MAKRSAEQIRKEAERIAELKAMELEYDQQIMNSVANTLRMKKELGQEEREYLKDLFQMQEILKTLKEDSEEMHINTQNALRKTLSSLQERLDKNKKILTVNKSNTAELTRQAKVIESSIVSGVQTYWKFLMEADSAIKTFNRDLGLTGERAEMVRSTIEQTAVATARMGARVKDVAAAYQSYTNEIGRAVQLTEEQLSSIVAIGKGTGLGVEQAGLLAGKFELLGMNATATAQKVQGIVESSERMGVNATKVLKAVADNFQTLQRYTFRSGVQGMAQLAQYAEKFKIDFTGALDSAETARTLEGAVEMAAKLQVLGGEFAKTDPFEMLFLARNDPEKYAEKLNKMVAGVARFRKTADGSFEQFISPLDMDRLRRAEEALGLQAGELSKQAFQYNKIARIRQQMAGTGLSREEMELIEGIAQIDEKTGKAVVKIGDEFKQVAKLTSQETKLLETQNKSLEQRAEAARTFDEAWQDTLQELKAVGLPLLRGINDVLGWLRKVIGPIHETTEGLVKGGKTWMSVAAKIGMAGIAIYGAIKTFKGMSGLIRGLSGMVSMMGGGKGGGIGGMMGGMSPDKVSGMGSSLKGVGVAAAGVGVGIGAAAAGFAAFAKAIEGLDTEKMDFVREMVYTIGLGIPIMTAGLIGLATVSSVASGPLLALGGAVALIGAGIGIASAGMGVLAMGISKVATDEVADNIFKVSGGVAALMGSMALGLNPMTILGLGALAGSVAAIAASGSGMEKVGNSFKQIAVVMNGSVDNIKEVERSIRSIASADISQNQSLGRLAEILSKPIKVEFAERDVSMNVSVNLNVDGDRLTKVVTKKQIPIIKDIQNGSTSI